jgi:hypothetical protein
LNGFEIKNSNIADLTSYLIKAPTSKPVGGDDLIRFLWKINAPLSLIGNTTVANSIRNLQKSVVTSKRKNRKTPTTDTPKRAPLTPIHNSPTSKSPPQPTRLQKAFGWTRQHTGNGKKPKTKKRVKGSKGSKGRKSEKKPKNKTKTKKLRWKKFG